MRLNVKKIEQKSKNISNNHKKLVFSAIKIKFCWKKQNKFAILNLRKKL